MPGDDTDMAICKMVRETYGDTSGLREELVNTLTNIYYFADKAQKLNFGGLSDLAHISLKPAKAYRIGYPFFVLFDG